MVNLIYLQLYTLIQIHISIFQHDLAITYNHPQGLLSIQKTYLFINVTYVKLKDKKHIYIR